MALTNREKAVLAIRDAAKDFFRDRRTMAVGVGGTEDKPVYNVYRNAHRSSTFDVARTTDFRGVLVRFLDMRSDFGFALSSGPIEQDLRLPPTLGSQIKNDDDSGGWGSLGCFLNRGGDPVMLSNNHVLANYGSGQLGDDIVHPSMSSGNAHVADLLDWKQLISTPAYLPCTSYVGLNEVDAAIASMKPGVKAINVFRSSRGLPPLTHLGTPEVDAMVHKVGAASGQTDGTIESFATILRVRDHGSIYCFENAIVIDGVPTNSEFTLRGDSGSVVFTINASKTACVGVAMIFARTDDSVSSGLNRAIACDINKAISELGCSGLF